MSKYDKLFQEAIESILSLKHLDIEFENSTNVIEILNDLKSKIDKSDEWPVFNTSELPPGSEGDILILRSDKYPGSDVFKYIYGKWRNNYVPLDVLLHFDSYANYRYKYIPINN